MRPLSILIAPNQRTATLDTLRTSINTGNMAAIQRPTDDRDVGELGVGPAKPLGLERLANEGAEHPDARCLLTEDPVHDVDPTLHQSIAGHHVGHDEADRYPSTGTATATSQNSPTSSRSAMIIPPTIMIGAINIMVRLMKTRVWTC